MDKLGMEQCTCHEMLLHCKRIMKHTNNRLVLFNTHEIPSSVLGKKQMLCFNNSKLDQ